MRVSPVRFSSSSKTNNNQSRNVNRNSINQSTFYNNPSFKADVRVDYKPIDSFPEAHQKLIRQVLDHAKTAYKDLGDDNMLFFIRPIVATNWRPKNNMYSIAIKRTFKDAELAGTSILKNNDRDFPNDDDPDIEKLRNKDPKVMERLKMQKETCVQFMPLYNIPHELIRHLDDDMEAAVRKMTYGVPEEPKKYTGGSGINEHYLGEFMSGGY